ncbi:Rna-directed Rna polymerase, partial [Cardiosporidium cionae]
NYNISLFQRLEGVNFKVNILSTQYRMHPEISRFPSTTFYNSQLKDAENILQLAIPPFPWNTIPLFKPLVFFTIDSQHVEEGSSLINTEEAFFAVQLLDLLRSVLLEVGPSNPPWTQRVAIISPYSMQVQRIRRLVKSLLGIPMGKLCPIDVNTVDGFQGREKDFVIFSAVRAHFVGDGSTKKKSIGFLADERRMNVALTRARLNLWVIGNGRFLMGNPHWCQFWKHCCNTETLFNVNFERLPQKDYLKRWLCGFFKRQP